MTMGPPGVAMGVFVRCVRYVAVLDKAGPNREAGCDRRLFYDAARMNSHQNILYFLHFFSPLGGALDVPLLA